MPFRRVEAEQAGPEALGILIPPGKRTLIVLRPRALDWDLLPMGPLGEGEAVPLFWEVGREQAQTLAVKLFEALEAWADGGNGRVDAIAIGDGYQVRAAVGPFVLIVCPRVPGQRYQPLFFDTVSEAQNAVDALAPYLCPPAETERQAYLNSKGFTLENKKREARNKRQDI